MLGASEEARVREGLLHVSHVELTVEQEPEQAGPRKLEVDEAQGVGEEDLAALIKTMG